MPVLANQDVQSDPSGRWQALALLATATLLGMSPWFSASAVVSQLRTLWALDAAQAAWITMAVQLGFVVGALGSAILNMADRVRPRRLMLYGCLAAMLANAALLLQPPVLAAILLRAITGMSLAAVYPPAMKGMSTWFRFKRGTALGVMVGAITLGSGAPHLINALGGLDWRVVIVATSGMTLAGGLLAEYVGRDGPFAFPVAGFEPRQIFQVFANRPMRLACIGYFGHMWELYAMWAWFSVFFADVLHRSSALGSTWAASGTFIVIAVGALGSWLIGGISDRWGRANAATLALVTSGGCCLVIGFMPGLPWAMVFAVGLIWGFSVVADSAQFSTALTELGDPAYVGTALTVQLALGYLLTIPTLWLVPLLHEQFGWGMAFVLLAFGPLVGTIAMRRLNAVEASRK